MGADRLDFRILGGLSVIRDGGAVEIGRGRLPALLALLVLERHHVVSAESLIDALWDGRPPKTASTVLQGYVSQLRKLLEPGRASGDPPQLLITEASGYVLHVADEGLDSARFERLLARGRHELASGDAAVAAATLDNALSLWRGPALADFAYDAWAQHEIARLEELRLAAREERIEAQLACGEHTDAVPELERLVREQPLRERVRAQLILALYRSGRQAEALEAYAQTRHRLREDLGVDPTPELQQLYKQVLNQDSAIAAPGRPSPYPQTTLPSPPSRLIGRDQDIELVAGTLGADDARLVTLIGPGGVGKTRLALAVAWSCRDRYSDGVYLCRPLAGDDAG